MSRQGLQIVGNHLRSIDDTPVLISRRPETGFIVRIQGIGKAGKTR